MRFDFSFKIFFFISIFFSQRKIMDFVWLYFRFSKGSIFNYCVLVLFSCHVSSRLVSHRHKYFPLFFFFEIFTFHLANQKMKNVRKINLLLTTLLLISFCSVCRSCSQNARQKQEIWIFSSYNLLFSISFFALVRLIVAFCCVRIAEVYVLHTIFIYFYLQNFFFLYFRPSLIGKSTVLFSFTTCLCLYVR